LVKVVGPFAQEGIETAQIGVGCKSFFSPDLLRRIAEELADPRPARRVGERQIINRMPERLPLLTGELALWRAFLSEAINAIIRGDE
jgi:hypothetical protein